MSNLSNTSIGTDGSVESNKIDVRFQAIGKPVQPCRIQAGCTVGDLTQRLGYSTEGTSLSMNGSACDTNTVLQPGAVISATRAVEGGCK